VSTKICDKRVPIRKTIHNLVNKLRTTALSADKKQNYKRWALNEEKFDDIGVRLEHVPRKSLKSLAQETGVSKAGARTATQLLKPSSESWCLVRCKWKKDWQGLLYMCFNETINCEKYCHEFMVPWPIITSLDWIYWHLLQTLLITINYYSSKSMTA
jgi:hypothetical protein